MILRDEVAKHMGNDIKIGFNKGSNFIFCDEVRDNILDILAEIEEQKVQDCKELLRRSRERHKVLLKQGVDHFCNVEIMRINTLNSRNPGGPKIPIPPRDKMEDKYHQMLFNLVKTMDRCKKTLSMDHPVLDAEVVEVYGSISKDTPDTKIIICDGNITGAFWTKEEFVSGKVDYNEDDE